MVNQLLITRRHIFMTRAKIAGQSDGRYWCLLLFLFSVNPNSVQRLSLCLPKPHPHVGILYTAHCCSVYFGVCAQENDNNKVHKYDQCIFQSIEFMHITQLLITKSHTNDCLLASAFFFISFSQPWPVSPFWYSHCCLVVIVKKWARVYKTQNCAGKITTRVTQVGVYC